MQLPHNFLLYLSAFALLVLGARVYIRIAKKYGILDIPNKRSSHTEPIIRGGGVLFYLAFLIFFLITNFQFRLLFLGISLLAIVSFIDDIRELSVKQRIPAQILSVLLILLELDFYSQWWIIPILIVIGILFINCYNFIDGVNGMLGLYSSTVFLFLVYLSYQEKLIEFIDLPILILLAIVIFGFYNFRIRALFFSGDVGSVTLGILAFFLLLYFSFSLNAPILILIVAVSLTDTLGTIAKRFFAGKNILKAHREHIYEQLSDKTSLSHLKISMGYAFFQVIINVLVFFTYNKTVKFQLVVMGFMSILLSFIYYIVNRKLHSI